MKKKSPPKRTRNNFENGIQNGLSNVLGLNSGVGFMFPGNTGAQVSQVDTLWMNNRWYLVSNMRQLLSECYIEHGLVQAAVDLPVEDGLRGGVVIKSKQLSPDNILEVQAKMEHHGDMTVVNHANKWNRLFGGAGIVTLCGQEPSLELNTDILTNDESLEFRAVDMWELFWSEQNVGDYDPQTQLQDFDYYNYYQVQLHKSRVMPLKGKTAPSFVRPRLRGWGLSVVEWIIRSINQYLKSTDLVFEVLDEFKIDYYKIKNLTNSLLSATGEAGLKRRLQIMNKEKNFNHAVTMDSEDDFIQRELSFAGLAETMQGIRLQVASDLRMPMSKLFGIGAQGFSSGEDDIENYNGMIESSIRTPGKRDIIRIIQLRCQQLFGFIPEDLTIEFKPLRILSAEQEENVKSQKHARLMSTVTSGLMTVKEFKEAINHDNLLGVQLDTSVDKLEQIGGEESETAEKAPKSKLQAKNSMENLARIACIGFIAGDEVLTGKRRDNGLWTFPGGHMEDSETPAEAVVREAMEESGILISDSQLVPIPPSSILKSHRGGKDFQVYPFVARIDKEKATPKNDPDKEITQWKWVKISPNTPELKPENRHAKNDMILDYLFKGYSEYEHLFRDMKPAIEGKL